MCYRRMSHCRLYVGWDWDWKSLGFGFFGALIWQPNFDSRPLITLSPMTIFEGKLLANRRTKHQRKSLHWSRLCPWGPIFLSENLFAKKIYLQINLQVVGFRVKNTHNYIWNDYSTKKVHKKHQSPLLLYFLILSFYYSFEFGCGTGSLSFPTTIWTTCTRPTPLTSGHKYLKRFSPIREDRWVYNSISSISLKIVSTSIFSNAT